MRKGAAFKILTVLHKALLMSQLLFCGICFYLVYTKSVSPPAKELDKILQVAALIFVAGGIYGGMVFFKKKFIASEGQCRQRLEPVQQQPGRQSHHL